MIWRPLLCRFGLHLWRSEVTLICSVAEARRNVTGYRCARCDHGRKP